MPPRLARVFGVRKLMIVEMHRIGTELCEIVGDGNSNYVRYRTRVAENWRRPIICSACRARVTIILAKDPPCHAPILRN